MSPPPAADAPPTYRVAPADLERDRATVLELWRDNLGDPARHATKFDWFYRDNPFGRPLLQLLYHGDRAIGCAGAGPRRMRCRGRDIHAGLLADFAVVREHRTLGPALMLQQAMREAAAGHFELLYGFPNPGAVPIFKRGGFTLLGELTRHARVLRHGPYLERRLPHWLAAPAGLAPDLGRALLERVQSTGEQAMTARWRDQPGELVDELWQRAPRGDNLVAVRERAMLQWRFEQSALDTLRYLEVFDRHGAPAAWFACQVRDGVLQVRDFWSTDAPRTLAPGAVLALLHAARQHHCTSVSVELAAAPELLASWHQAGFHARESQPVIGQWLDQNHEPAPTPPELFLTNLDEDE